MSSCTRYAKVAWSWPDVQELRPEWTQEKCEDWLANNAKYIQEALVQQGFKVIEDLITE